jgi:acylphosphatase
METPQSSGMSEAAARWVVSGRVQGVGFRWFAVRLAEKTGVTGWVRNLPDGRVEIAAKGSAEALSELEKGLRAGPGTARVEGVEKSDIPHELIDRNSFDIR